MLPVPARPGTRAASIARSRTWSDPSARSNLLWRARHRRGPGHAHPAPGGVSGPARPVGPRTRAAEWSVRRERHSCSRSRRTLAPGRRTASRHGPRVDDGCDSSTHAAVGSSAHRGRSIPRAEGPGPCHEIAGRSRFSHFAPASGKARPGRRAGVAADQSVIEVPFLPLADREHEVDFSNRTALIATAHACQTRRPPRFGSFMPLTVGRRIEARQNVRRSRSTSAGLRASGQPRRWSWSPCWSPALRHTDVVV